MKRLHLLSPDDFLERRQRLFRLARVRVGGSKLLAALRIDTFAGSRVREPGGGQSVKDEAVRLNGMPVHKVIPANCNDDRVRQ